MLGIFDRKSKPIASVLCEDARSFDDGGYLDGGRRDGVALGGSGPAGGALSLAAARAERDAVNLCLCHKVSCEKITAKTIADFMPSHYLPNGWYEKAVFVQRADVSQRASQCRDELLTSAA